MLAVTYNIQWGKGRDGRIDLDRIARTVKDADIIALQEVERNWREQDYPDQAGRLGELLPDYHWVYGPAVDLGGGSRNRRRQIGNMILSRSPISSTRTLPLPARAVHGHVNDQQSMIEAVVERGEGLRVYNLHLNYLSQHQRLEQIRFVTDFVTEAPARGGAITMPGKAALGPEDAWVVLPGGKLPAMPRAAVLLGDFNAGPAGPEYSLITGELIPGSGRAAGANRFADVLTLAGMREDEGVTFPASGGEPAQRLDHCFVSNDLIARVKRAWIDEEAVGSDHQPVWVELSTDA